MATDTKPAGHSIAIAPAPGRIRVRAGGRTVAESVRALRLDETGLPPVFYIPREDVEMGLFARTAHRTHCPFKGDASYFSALGTENIAWSYEAPLPQAAAIAGHLAFYPGKVDAIEALPG